MRVKILTVLAVAAVMLGGCSDKKTTTNAAATDTTVKDSSSDSKASTASSSSDASEGAAAAAFSSGKCAETAAAMGKAASGISTGSTADLKASVEALDAFVKAAPSEIRPDLKIVAEGYATLATILADAKFDPSSGETPSPEAIKKLTEAGEKLDQAEFKAAADRVSKWFTEKCGK